MVCEGHYQVLSSLIIIRVRDCGVHGAAICDRRRLVEGNRVRPRASRSVRDFRQHLVVHPIVFEG